MLITVVLVTVMLITVVLVTVMPITVVLVTVMLITIVLVTVMLITIVLVAVMLIINGRRRHLTILLTYFQTLAWTHPDELMLHVATRISGCRALPSVTVAAGRVVDL